MIKIYLVNLAATFLGIFCAEVVRLVLTSKIITEWSAVDYVGLLWVFIYYGFMASIAAILVTVFQIKLGK